MTTSAIEHETKHIGEPTSRIEGRSKVTGEARYAAEHPREGLLYGWIVSSAIPRGRIVRIDDSKARAVPGIVEIVTHENRPHLPIFDKRYTDEVAVPGSPFRGLYDAEIRFAMQPIALVVAESLELARYGASIVEVEYETTDFNTSLEAELPKKYEPKKKRDTFDPPKNRGDAQAALERAPLRFTGVYHEGTHHHNPMEMHATTVLWEGGGRITVYDKTQGSQNVQNYLASVFGFAKDDVRVLNPYVGGAFGSGLRPQYQVYFATLAAKMLERSVRVVMTRQQMFSHVHRPEALQTVSLATDEKGRLQSIVNEVVQSTSRFEDYMEVIVNWGLMNYACDNASGKHELAALDTYTPGDMRAPGAATGMTIFEMAIDEMAEIAKLDPLEFRLLNYSEKDAMDDKPYTSKALREAYAEGAKRFGWDGRPLAPRSMKDGRELVGWGVATGMWDAMFQQTSARATLRADGSLEVASATSDIGTGTYTVMAEVASDSLGVPLDRISVKLGDSALPTAPVEGGSWATASTGAAVHLACEGVKEKLLDAARKLDGKPLGSAKADDLVFADGRVSRRDDPSASRSIGDLLRDAGLAEIVVEETAKPGLLDKLSEMLKQRNTHSAIFAEARVDEELGVIRVPRIVIAVAAGRIVNPKAARSQILGGVVMGISMALEEETFMDHRFGRFMNHNLAEYHIPVNADIYDIDVIFVNEPDPDVTPLGVKGLGEIGIVGTAAAVANAIWHATGHRSRALPITIDHLLPAAKAPPSQAVPETVRI